jgi:hypothetical protein
MRRYEPVKNAVFTGIITDIHRMGTNSQGNPQYLLTFEGTGACETYELVARTTPNAMIGYALGNPEFRKGAHVRAKFNARYTISNLEAVNDNKEEQ